MAQEILDPVKVATNTSIIIANGIIPDSSSPDSIIDGEKLEVGDRILVKSQTDLKENGIYVVSDDQVSIGSVYKQLVRSTDFADASAHVSTIVFVRKGSLLGDTGFILDSAEDSITVGISDITFKRFTINSSESLAEVTSYLTLRTEKGYPLTNAELDNNFKYLGNALDDKVDIEDYTPVAIVDKINSMSFTTAGIDAAKIRSIYPALYPNEGETSDTLVITDQAGNGLYSIPVRDENGDITTNNFIGDLIGTADKLKKGLTGQTGDYYTNVNNVDAGLLPILHGGTGASTAFNARSSLQVVHLGGDTPMTGKLTFKAANASSASFNIPIATAAITNPAEGDVWTSGDSIYYRLNNTTQQVARINSPTFTGDPKINSVVRNLDSSGNTTDDLQLIPTLAYVKKFRDLYVQPNLDLKAPVDQPTFTNAAYLNYNVSIYPGVSDSSTKIATTQWVQQVKSDFLQNTIVPTYETIANVALKAPKASPVFTGSPTLNENILDVSTNNKILATTEWTQAVKADFLQNTIAPTYATYNYVNTSARWMGSNKFVSVNLPSAGDGVAGDIWIQTTQYIDETPINSGTYLLKTGDAATGYLTLHADPLSDYHAATKHYVDLEITTSISNLASTYINVSGDTMTGFLTLHANPTANLHAATKGYVDSAISGVASTYINVSGDTMTGFLTLHANPTANLHAATKGYVDSLVQGAIPTETYVRTSGDTMTGPLTLNGSPTANLHAATKQYVDNAIAGVTGTIDGLSSVYVSKSGDTMTGPLTLNGSPTANLHAATKKYVDDGITGLASTYVSKSGDTMTGLLTLSGAPTANLHAATKKYVDDGITGVNSTINSLAATYVNTSGDTMTGFLTLHSNPTSNLHAATKQYVDAKTSGPNVSTVSGVSHTYSYSNIVGDWTNSDNYFDVFPPSGWVMSNLQSFIASIWYIAFDGRVDYNDSMRCTYQLLSDRVRVYVGNTEQRANPAASWLAVWIK